MLLAGGCFAGPPDVPTEVMDRVDAPIGEEPSVFENRLHAAHLNRSTPVPCEVCHDINADEFVDPDRKRCEECHEDNKHTQHGDKAQCTDCHLFAAGEEHTEYECLICHENEQKKADGDKIFPIIAHQKVRCGNCHRAHEEPPIVARECTTCHDDHQQGHGKEGQSLVDRCSDCHKPHTKSIEAVQQCEGCHKDKLLRAVFKGHNKCETCHKSGTREKPTERIDCRDCHGARKIVGEDRAKEHRECKNCHSPHDPIGTASQSCRRCHEDIRPRHPSDKTVGACRGCHSLHDTGRSQSLSECSKCHKKARNDLAFHSAGGTSCTLCHEKHDFRPQPCINCHEEREPEVASNPGHKNCRKCHQTPHNPKAPAEACAACHSDQKDSAPAGHRECSKCHEAHSGGQKSTSGCPGCHQEQRRAIHGRIDGGCTSCHRPHGPRGQARPPKCTSCHKVTDLPGVHAVEDHRKDCERCHEGHRIRDLKRDTCLEKCHEEQVDHETASSSCVGCHPFAGSGQ